jgi:hypothetical protein
MSTSTIMDTIQRLEDIMDAEFDHNQGKIIARMPCSGRVDVVVRLSGVMLTAKYAFEANACFNTAEGRGFPAKETRQIADDTVLAARMLEEVEAVVAGKTWTYEHHHEEYIPEATALLKRRVAASGYITPGYAANLE